MRGQDVSSKTSRSHAARSRSCAYPPLEGEGRLILSVAKYETGWGDSLSTGTVQGDRPSPHPAAPFSRVDPPPPGEGEITSPHSRPSPAAAPARANRWPDENVATGP